MLHIHWPWTRCWTRFAEIPPWHARKALEIIPPLQQTICVRPRGPLSMLITAQDCSYRRGGGLAS